MTPRALVALSFGSLSLVAQALSEPVVETLGSSRESFYNGQVIWGTNRNPHENFGSWQLCSSAGVYLSTYEPQVTFVLHFDDSHTALLAGEFTWFSVPPGSTCIWDDEPGSVWLSDNLAQTFDPQTMLWHSASAGGRPPTIRGALAPRLVSDEWIVPMTLRIDQSDRWWHWLGRPEPWYLHEDWFAQLPTWLLMPSSDFATLRVRINQDTTDFSLDIHSFPPRHADVDRDGAVGVVDLFLFLSAWFSGSTLGDWNQDNLFSTPDIFSFLSSYFEGDA